MRIFILEDDPNRVMWMKRNFDKSIILDITDQVDDGMKWLYTREYDAIFLDHDLGGRVYVDSGEHNTGATVAKMIHKTKNKDLTVIVHSWNPAGAKNMMNSLTDNGVKAFYFPFQNVDFVSAVSQVNDQVESPPEDTQE